MDVADGGAGMDAEQVHQVYRVGGLSGLVQHAVAPHLARGDSGVVERAAQCAVADGRESGGCAEYVVTSRCGWGMRATVMPFLEPLVQEAVGQRVEIDRVQPAGHTGELGCEAVASRGGIGRAVQLRPRRRGIGSWTRRQRSTACCSRRTWSR